MCANQEENGNALSLAMLHARREAALFVPTRTKYFADQQGIKDHQLGDTHIDSHVHYGAEYSAAINTAQDVHKPVHIGLTRSLLDPGNHHSED
jgi:hypothetical protein